MTMKEIAFTLRIDEQLRRDFFAAAKTNDRNGAQLIREFMREYISKADTYSTTAMQKKKAYCVID